MQNWKEIAQARDLGIPAQDVDRVVAPLQALEQDFRPLVLGLTPDMEPAFSFHAGGDSE